MTISLNSNAGSLANGTYTGSIWITNLTTGLAQQLQFSLSVKKADYPIAVTGYNLDVVVENTAVGGDTTNYADTFDPACDYLTTPAPVCFYETGLTATNYLGGTAIKGLPQSGLFTSLFDGATTFQFGPYDSGNVLYLTSSAASGSLTLSTPAAYKSLSVLAASAQGGGNGTMVIHFADGTSSSAIPFNATNYLTTNTPGPGAAITNFGLLITGNYNEFGSVDHDYYFPTLYQTTTNLQSNGYDTKLITSVTFTMPVSANTNTVTGVFALSGTEASYNYVLTASPSPTNGGAVIGGGAFQEGSAVTVTAAANSGFEFIGWTGDATGTDNPLTIMLNTNLDITAHFAAIGTNITLTVITNAYGTVTVSPKLNDGDLKHGHGYTLTAIATSGNVFSGWTGSLTTSKNPLSFKAESNMVLQATFIPNPFLSVKGTYNGLFFDANNGVTEQTAGMLKGLAISQKGTYSGTLIINGGSHAISGSFGLAGQATNHISRAASQGGPLTVVMTLNGNEPPPQVTGTVSGTNNGVSWVANLTASEAANSLPPAEYTMLILPNTNNAPANSPGGDGYALITNHAGAANITGALADGAAFSQTMSVSQDGSVPIYANLYAGKGLLLGWINLDLTNTADVGLTWIHPKTRSGLYTNGFTNVLPANQILLSRWTNSPGNFDNLTNLSLLDTINNPEVLANIAVSITNTGKMTETGTKTVIGSITPKTGVFTVTLGSGASRVTGHGAIILLNGTNGGGYFLTKTYAGAIILGP